MIALGLIALLAANPSAPLPDCRAGEQTPTRGYGASIRKNVDRFAHLMPIWARKKDSSPPSPTMNAYSARETLTIYDATSNLTITADFGASRSTNSTYEKGNFDLNFWTGRSTDKLSFDVAYEGTEFRSGGVLLATLPRGYDGFSFLSDESGSNDLTGSKENFAKLRVAFEQGKPVAVRVVRGAGKKPIDFTLSFRTLPGGLKTASAALANLQKQYNANQCQLGR